MKKAFLTVGLGFGDEGKGTVVDFLTKEFNADLVVRYTGGQQCGHNVVKSDGTHHCFSQFGSGSLNGVPTYFGRNMVMDPFSLLREAQHLRAIGADNRAFDIYINKRTLVSNPWFQSLNRAKARLNGHGSCGAGVGETRRYYLEHGNDSIFGVDLNDPNTLADKLHLIRVRVVEELRQMNLLESKDGRFALSMSPNQIAKDMTKCLYDACRPWCVNKLPDWANTYVFEGAQGVLLDENFGFHPYTTWSTTTLQPAYDELYMMGVAADSIDLTKIGIIRTYMTRHGAGPFPSGVEVMNYDEPHNPYNEWQTDFRQGPIDFVLLKYAMQYAGNLDGLFVTHLDRPNHKYITDDNIGYSLEWLNDQTNKTGWLKSRSPIISHTDDMLGTIQEQLKLPILGASAGPTYEDKFWAGAVAV